MKAPICDICLRSSMLCSACNEKLKNGLITEADVKASRAVFEESGRMNTLRGVTIRRVIETPRNLVIIPQKGDASKMIGRGGMVSRKLTERLGKNVRVVEVAADMKDFIENIIFPVKVSAMNVLYAEEGECTKVIIPDLSRSPVPEDTLREVLEDLYGKRIRFVKE